MREGRKEKIERIAMIMTAMAVNAMEKAPDGGKEIASLAGSPNLHACFAVIENGPDEQIAEFLNMLEAGIPKKLRKQLKKEQRCHLKKAKSQRQ